MHKYSLVGADVQMEGGGRGGWLSVRCIFRYDEYLRGWGEIPVLVIRAEVGHFPDKCVNFVMVVRKKHAQNEFRVVKI
jgi:hypothetical protein